MENSTTTVNLIDHGIKVIHDLASQPSHRLHEVSVPWEAPAPAGFQWHHGWRDRGQLGGRHWALYIKILPLEAA